MLGAGARLGPGPLRALPLVITSLAAQRLGRRRSTGPGARDLGLRARKLLLEPRVGSLEVVTEVLVVVGGDRLARRAAALGHRGDALARRQARADVPAPSGVRGGVRQVVARCVGLRGRLARGAQVLTAPALLLALGHVAAGMLAAVPRRAAGDDEVLRPGRQSVRGGDLAPLAQALGDHAGQDRVAQRADGLAVVDL